MIKRRTSLGAISASALAGSVIGAWPLFAKATNAATNTADFKATPKASPKARAKVGLVLPLTGVQGTVAKELLTGYQLAAAQARQVGIELQYEVEDDRSEPSRTAEAARRLGLHPQVVAISGIVGTPHAQAAIPEVRAARMPLVGIRSGAGQLRDGKGFVYHLRASYEAELDRMVRMLADTSPALSVVYSNDSFGIGALQHLKGRASKAGIRLVAAVAAERNGLDIDGAVRRAVAPGVHAQSLLLLMITRPAIQGLKTARQEAFFGPTFTMSFTAGSELLAAGAVVRGLGIVSAFPLPRDQVDPLAISFREAVETLGSDEIVTSSTALEGFIYGSTLAAGIARCGPAVDREALANALVRRPSLRVGSDPIEFDAQLVGRHRLRVLHFDRQGTLRA